MVFQTSNLFLLVFSACCGEQSVYKLMKLLFSAEERLLDNSKHEQKGSKLNVLQCYTTLWVFFFFPLSYLVGNWKCSVLPYSDFLGRYVTGVATLRIL